MPLKVLLTFLPLLFLLVSLIGLILCRLKMDTAKYELLSADQKTLWAEQNRMKWDARSWYQLGYGAAGLVFIVTGWTVPTAASVGWYLALGILTVVAAGLACANPGAGLSLASYPAEFIRRILRWHRWESMFALLMGAGLLLLAADFFCLK